MQLHSRFLIAIAEWLPKNSTINNKTRNSWQSYGPATTQLTFIVSLSLANTTTIIFWTQLLGWSSLNSFTADWKHRATDWGGYFRIPTPITGKAIDWALELFAQIKHFFIKAVSSYKQLITMNQAKQSKNIKVQFKKRIERGSLTQIASMHLHFKLKYT